MEIDFDPNKDKANRQKHGVPLALGRYVIADESCLAFVDDRKDYGEERIIALGEVRGRVFVAVYTMRGPVHRFISVRKANATETAQYRARRD